MTASSLKSMGVLQPMVIVKLSLERFIATNNCGKVRIIKWKRHHLEKNEPGFLKFRAIEKEREREREREKERKRKRKREGEKQKDIYIYIEFPLEMDFFGVLFPSFSFVLSLSVSFLSVLSRYYQMLFLGVCCSPFFYSFIY